MSVLDYAIAARVSWLREAAIERLLAGPSPQVNLDLELSGPVRRVRGYATMRPLPAPGHQPCWLHFFSYQADDRVFRRPRHQTFEIGTPPARTVLSGHEDAEPRVLRVRGRAFYACAPGLLLEAYRPVFRDGRWVDEMRELEGAGLYRFQCECGRFRIVPRSSLTVVRWCWPCTFQQREAKRLATRPCLRTRMPRRRLSLHEERAIVRRVITDGAPARVVARELEVPEYTISRYLKRRGLR